MGCIPARHIPAYLTPDSIVDVYDEARTACFPKDYEAILDLCEAGQVWGSTKGARLRYVVLMVPISEMRSTERARQSAHSASDAIAQDNRTVRRGHDITALHYDHDMRVSRAYGLPRFTAAFPRVHAHHNDPDGPRVRPAAAALRPAAAARVSLAGKLAQAQP